MRRLFLALSLCTGLGVICVQPIQAQNASRPDPDLQFYLFASRGVVSGVKVGPSIPVEPYSSWQFGGGGEWFKFKGLAVGAELAVSPVEGMSKIISLGLAIITSAALVSPQAVAFHSHQEVSQKTAMPTQTAKQCGPGIAGTLFLVGLAFATKSPALLRRPLPCADEPQEVRQKPRVLEVRKQATEYRLAKLPAAEALREARMLYIRQRSSRFNPQKLERELLKRKEFGEMGLELTRNADRTDLVLEITRKRFTTRFTCSIIEPGSERVLAATTASSLGGEIEPHLAEAILKEFKAARTKSANEEKE